MPDTPRPSEAPAGPSRAAAGPSRAAAGLVPHFRGRLRVFWWTQDGRGRWVEVHHAPVEVAFADAAGLRAELAQFSRPAGWSRVLAQRADLGLGAVLHERHAALDFEAAAGRFLAALRAGGRSRCELALHEARADL